MSQDLVSILTPCYNTGKYIHRLLDSVLSQTYSAIEMIVVDDGSTDNSKDIIKSYIPKFEARGYDLKYLYQENSGQSVAIQKGLHLVNGKYLTWPDSDDFYASRNAIAIMVSEFEKSPMEIGVVRCMQRIVEEASLKEVQVDGTDFKEGECKLFDDCLFFLNGFYIQPISFMARYSTLYETTNFNLYTCKKGGQNWQMLLPVFYSYKCYTIKMVLTNVLQRSNSHSREILNYDCLVEKSRCFETVAVETVKRIKLMSSFEMRQYINKLQCNYSRERMAIAYKNRKRKDYIRFYHEWRAISNEANRIGNRMAYLAVKLHFELLWELFRNCLSR
jgi:glycosyltransferase involved in cell wall biosynthesis